MDQSINTQAYLCALDRIESALYTVQNFTILSQKEANQAVKDVCQAIEKLRQIKKDD